MMDPDDLASYAAGVADALRRIGPKPHAELVKVVCGLQLTEQEAERVISEGIARGILRMRDELVHAA